MKYKLLSIVCSVCIFCSCSDFLDREPISQLTPESFWQTSQDAEVGVVAIYNVFSKGMASNIWDWGELRSDNFVANTKGAFQQMELTKNSILNDNRAAQWTYLYETIGKANSAIKYIPNIEMTPTKKNHLLGEAYAMRAWSYFYCVRVWGDVPLFTEPIESTNDELYRERTDANYILKNVIVPDLERAYYLLDKTNTVRTRMNVGTLCALLMDVYAWMHDYENVVKVKEEKVDALSSANWSMTNITSTTEFQSKWRAMFIEDASVNIPNEVFFKIAYDQYGNGQNRSVSYFATTYSLVYISDNLTNAYFYNGDAKDERNRNGCQWEREGSETPKPYRMKKKFWKDGAEFKREDKEISDNDLTMYRYADILLLYAEALNELGFSFDAVEALNVTRVRAGNNRYVDTQFSGKDDLLDAILNERQREFVGEGKRWFDLVRTNRWKQVMEPINGMNEEWQVLFPIHRDHLVQNYKLVQNKGYQGI